LCFVLKEENLQKMWRNTNSAIYFTSETGNTSVLIELVISLRSLLWEGNMAAAKKYERIGEQVFAKVDKVVWFIRVCMHIWGGKFKIKDVHEKKRGREKRKRIKERKKI
jgi:hypothetical protein